jgi:hypothetical protein
MAVALTTASSPLMRLPVRGRIFIIAGSPNDPANVCFGWKTDTP